MRLLITANCQSYGIAAALSAMCDIPQPVCVQNIGVSPQEYKSQLTQALSAADVIIYANNNTIAQEIWLAANTQVRAVKIPLISFHAFHPDVCYACHGVNKVFTTRNHNSFITLWSYKRHLSISSAAKLFRSEIYEALGYYDAWPFAVERMQDSFSNSDLSSSFEEFYLSIKRLGCFMHTINHPNISVLTRLSRLVAKHIGLPVTKDISIGQLNDNLNIMIWPVYQEIAESLGLPTGSYTWKFQREGCFLASVEDYLAATYERYRTEGFTPETLTFVPSDVQYINSFQQIDSILDALL
jgi:hypothetical protein